MTKPIEQQQEVKYKFTNSWSNTRGAGKISETCLKKSAVENKRTRYYAEAIGKTRPLPNQGRLTLRESILLSSHVYSLLVPYQFLFAENVELHAVLRGRDHRKFTTA